MVDNAKGPFLTMFTPEIHGFKTTNYMDMNQWLANQIEASFNALKNR